MDFRNSFQVVIAGEERSGKSYWADKFIKEYTRVRGTALVYNFGKVSDFPDDEYKLLEPVLFSEHIANVLNGDKDLTRIFKMQPVIDKFKIGHSGIEMHDFKNFNFHFYPERKKLKMFRITNRPEERAFLDTLYKYVSKCLFVMDDCTSSFRSGLASEHQNFFGRKNHTGGKSSLKELRNKGIDVLNIFHNVDKVNPEIWDYTNSLIMFKSVMKPTGKTMTDDNAIQAVQKASKMLDQMPKYSALEVHLKGENRYKIFDCTVN